MILDGVTTNVDTKISVKGYPLPVEAESRESRSRLSKVSPLTAMSECASSYIGELRAICADNPEGSPLPEDGKQK